MIGTDIVQHFNSKKIISLGAAAKKIDELKKNGKRPGLCHGGFDLLHPGHIIHFESAKKTCDYLFISITQDRFVTGRKGSGRPIFPDKLRAYSVASIEFVDYVMITQYKKGVEVIKKLKPSYYIKGPDFIHKTTPGITAEKEAIKAVGGEIKYTNDPKLSTTELVNYIKEKIKRKKILIGVDRDGTLIESVDFLGKDDKWKKKTILNNPVIDYLLYLQTKYDTTIIVITNQSGVARDYLDCDKVEAINKYINDIITEKGIQIAKWKYCPYVDKKYAEKMKSQIKFNPKFIKEKTCRKPSHDMLFEALKERGEKIEDFDNVIILGDREEDKGLAQNLNATFIDVKEKSYKDILRYFR